MYWMFLTIILIIQMTLNASTFSDELFLQVFSYLDPWQLSVIERVDKHFMRLANDQMVSSPKSLSPKKTPSGSSRCPASCGRSST